MSRTARNLELTGKALLLFAVGFQLTFLSSLQSIQSEGAVYHLMENQAFLGYMVAALAGSKSETQRLEELKDAQQRLVLYSEWNKSPLHSQTDLFNGIFLVLFLFGSVLTLYARYLELSSAKIHSAA